MATRSQVNISSLVNANSQLVAENTALRARVADLEAQLRQYGPIDTETRSRSERRTSLTGTIDPSSEMVAHGKPSFIINMPRGYTQRVIAADSDIADEMRRADPDEIVVISGIAEHVGIKAEKIGFIDAWFTHDGVDDSPHGRGEHRIWAMTDQSVRLKVFGTEADGLEKHRRGDQVALRGAFRSMRSGKSGKYFPYFFTENALKEELARRMRDRDPEAEIPF